MLKPFTEIIVHISPFLQYYHMLCYHYCCITTLVDTITTDFTAVLPISPLQSNTVSLYCLSSDPIMSSLDPIMSTLDLIMFITLHDDLYHLTQNSSPCATVALHIWLCSAHALQKRCFHYTFWCMIIIILNKLFSHYYQQFASLQQLHVLGKLLVITFRVSVAIDKFFPNSLGTTVHVHSLATHWACHLIPYIIWLARIS